MSPAAYMLSNEAKKNYLSVCDIVDSNTKMVDLMRNFDLFSIQMENSFWMSQRLGLFYLFVSTDAFYYYTLFCWWVGFGLNLTMMLGFGYKDHSGDYETSSVEYERALLAFIVMLIISSALFLALWMIFKYYPTYKISVENYKFESTGKEITGFFANLRVFFIDSYFSQAFPQSYSLHLLFTVLGITVSPFFYTINLLLIINISPTTKFVLKAILLHIDQLAITFMLAIFIIFCYTIIVMGDLQEQIDVERQNLVCRQLAT